MVLTQPLHFADGALTPGARYDPRYDPLVAADPGAGRAYAPTYWVASAGAPPDDDGPVMRDSDADVVIIGSGSTGISTALYLAQEHGIRAVVLEANRTAWGCSSRSGGQGQNASGRLKRSQWIARWGLDVAQRLDAEIRRGFDNFKHLTTQIDCDACDGWPPLHRASPAAVRRARGGSPGQARAVRPRHAFVERCGTAPRVLRRARGGRRPVRSRRRGHPPAQADLRSDQPGARAGRQGPSGQPGAGVAHGERASSSAHARRHRARQARRGVHRRLHRAGAEPAAERQADADPVELGRHARADRLPN